MMLTDEKCNAVAAWMNDILFPPGDKPWGVKPTPVPDLEPGQMEEVKVSVMQEAQQMMRQHLVMEIQAGNIQNEQQAKEWMLQNMQARAEELAKQIRDEMEAAAKEARDRIERKLDDVLVESNWQDAVMDTIDDIVTFPSGIVKGPVIRKKKGDALEGSAATDGYAGAGAVSGTGLVSGRGQNRGHDRFQPCFSA